MNKIILHIILSIIVMTPSFLISSTDANTSNINWGNNPMPVTVIGNVTMKHDVTGIGTEIGKEIGKAMSTSIEKVIKDGSETFEKALSDKELGDNLSRIGKEMGNAMGKAMSTSIEKVVKDGSEAFGKALSDKELGDNLSRGTKGLANNISRAFGDTFDNETLSEELKRGGGALADRMGDGLGSFNEHSKRTYSELSSITRRFASSVVNWRNAFQYGSILGFSIALPVTGYYGTKVAWAVIEKKLTDPKPEICLPGSKYGYKDRIKRWWSGYKSPDMVFNKAIEDRLLEIVQKTTYIRNNIKKGIKLTFDNLLLHGKPGTGKTLFATILADRTDMDLCVITAASLLQSGVKGTHYFDELVTMAKKSKYGLIIFIDEADALFVDRDSLDPASDHYKVLSHILAHTGDGSNKFMIVAATNHAHVIDGAMARRFQDRVDMILPDSLIREKLIHVYANSVLFNEKENSKQFIQAAQAILTKKCINTIVQQTDGLSHAEIKDIVHAMRKKGLATEKGIITVNHVMSAVTQGVEKHNAFEKDHATK